MLDLRGLLFVAIEPTVSSKYISPGAVLHSAEEKLD
jgi:hypothetical protein